RLVYSQADQVEASVAQVKATIVEGALLTVLIVFLFLHSWRSTIITGLTLPIAVIATFIALYACGFTLNMMTLLALSLCIGLLFVSFSLDPMLSSVWRDPPGSRFSRVPWLGRFMDRVERVVDWVHVLYGKLLEWAISDAHHRLYVPTIGLWTALRTGQWRALKP